MKESAPDDLSELSRRHSRNFYPRRLTKDEITFTKHQAYQNDKDLITAIKGGQVRNHFPTRKTNRESECFKGEA